MTTSFYRLFIMTRTALFVTIKSFYRWFVELNTMQNLSFPETNYLTVTALDENTKKCFVCPIIMRAHSSESSLLTSKFELIL